MTCIVISGVRASDKQRHVIELDLAALKVCVFISVACPASNGMAMELYVC
jgi:hypothetical protein